MIVPEEPIIIFKNELMLGYFFLLIACVLYRSTPFKNGVIKGVQWVLFIRFLFRLVDILFILNYGNHFTSLVYSDTDLESTLHFMTLGSWAQLVLAIGGGVIIFRQMSIITRRSFNIASSDTKRFSLYMFYAFLPVLILSMGKKRTGDYLKKYTTEAIILAENYEYFFSKNVFYELDIELSKKLKHFELQTDSNYVKIKPKVFSNTSNVPVSLNIDKPNVFLYLLESNTQNLISYYNKSIPALTPNIDSFLTDSNTIRFTHAINSGEPTLNSLLSYLFSMQSVITHDDVRENRIVFRDGFFSVATVLKNNGYNCYYITGITKNFTQVGRIFGNSDFQVYDEVDVQEVLKEEPLAWGYSDHQLARYYKYFIENIAVKPYFIAVTTIEGHKPYSSYADSKVYKDGKDPILNANHSTDDAFGQLYSFMKSSNELDRTLLVVGADHPPHPTASYLGVLEEKNKQHPSYHEKIPLAIRFPEKQKINQVDELFSTIDFSPTLLHILGINSPNLFEGKSHFERDSTRLRFFTKAYDINYYNDILGNNFQRNKIKELSLTEEDVNAYFKWKKASFLPKYLDKVKDIKKSIND
jgi:hypothetical protein